MKKLLKKEMVLTAPSITYFFIAFSCMTMIPGYPILLGAFFVCLGIFYSFQFGREYNDTLYTALLPVKKRDVVSAKYAFVILIEGISFVLSLLLTLLRMSLLSEAKPYATNPLMNANLAYLGYLLMIFAFFNLVFLAGFFKTAYYIGKPFIGFGIVSILVVGTGETLHHIPGLEGLNATGFENLGVQSVVLLIGIVFYVVGTALSFKKSVMWFEKIDL